MGPVLSVCLAVAPATAAPAPDKGAEGTSAAASPVEPAAPAAPAPPHEVDEEGRFPMNVRAAYGHGVAFEAPDGGFGVDLRARMQLRGVWAVAPTAAEDERVLLTALVRRARLTVDGFLFHRAVTWKLELAFAADDLERDLPVPLRDAFATWHVSPAFNLRGGEMKVPFSRQRLISSSKLQFPDRSRVEGELHLERDVGLQAYATDLFDLGGIVTYHLGVFAGEGRNRAIPDEGILGVIRLQVAPFGKFDDMSEGDLERGEDVRLALAAAAAYNSRSRRERSTHGDVFEDPRATVDYLHGVLDGIVKWRGLSFMGELLARNAVTDGAGAPTRSAIGWFLQGGYMFTPLIEIVARGAHIEPLDEDIAAAPSEVEPATQLAAGANAYFLEHDLKLQTDVTWEPDLEHPTLTWRTQLQLYF